VYGATARASLHTINEKPRGGFADSLKTLLTGEWKKRAILKEKLLAIGCGLATVNRTASELRFTGELQQDRRGRLTFWRTMPVQPRKRILTVIG